MVRNVAFGEETIAVDTHIFRVSNRIPLVVAPTTDKVQAGLEALVPAPYRLNAHHWLILFGRYICKARKPECPRCPIADLCRFPAKTPRSLTQPPPAVEPGSSDTGLPGARARRTPALRANALCCLPAFG